MSIVTLLSLISFILYLILSLYVLAKNIKSKTNILFFLTVLSLAIWSFMLFLTSVTAEKGLFFYLVKGSVFFAILFFTFNLVFFIELTLTGKYKKSFIITAVILSIFLIIKYTFSKELLYINVIWRNNSWQYIYLNSFWTYLLLAAMSVYTLLPLFLIYSWSLKSASNKIKAQAKIIFITLFSGLLSSLSEAVLFPNISSFSSLGLTPVLASIWILGIFYAITKYRFLSITPELISNDIISNITESIIILDENMKIILVNKKTEEIFKDKTGSLANKDLSQIVLKSDLIKDEVFKMVKNQYKDFSCRIHFSCIDEPVLMDAKFSKVFDKFNDLIGILIIASEVKELKQLKLFYKLSDREVEIVQLIIEGLSNKEIGTETNLTENTVKSHVMHIFDKLNVRSRMEMLNLLTEYNLIPRNSVRKKLFHLN